MLRAHGQPSTWSLNSTTATTIALERLTRRAHTLGHLVALLHTADFSAHALVTAVDGGVVAARRAAVRTAFGA